MSQMSQMNEMPKIDWVQVKMNTDMDGHGPCWHLYEGNEGENDSFCLRARRWSGHDREDRSNHSYVSLEEYIKTVVSGAVFRAVEEDRAVRAEQEFLEDEPDEAEKPLIQVPFFGVPPSLADEQFREAENARRRRIDEVMLLTEVLKAEPRDAVLDVVEKRLIEALNSQAFGVGQ